MSDDHHRLTVGVDHALDDPSVVILNGRGEVVATSHDGRSLSLQDDDTERMFRPGAVIGTAGADIMRRTYPMLGPWAEAPLLQEGDPVTWDGDPYKVVSSIASGLTRRIRLRSERQARVEAEVERILDEVYVQWEALHNVPLPRHRRRWWPGRG